MNNIFKMVNALGGFLINEKYTLPKLTGKIRNIIINNKFTDLEWDRCDGSVYMILCENGYFFAEIAE